MGLKKGGHPNMYRVGDWIARKAREGAPELTAIMSRRIGDRNVEIYESFLDGLTMRDIARAHGITLGRVSQIVIRTKELLACVACVLILSAIPALADQISVTLLPHKAPFAERHPKLHKLGRGFRRTCQRLQPVVNFGGSCAQIVMCFTRFH